MLPSAEAAKLYQTNYVRNSRVIGLLWAIFTILFGIVNVTIFSQPYWIGDGVDTPQAGYFGLFHYCIGDGHSRDLDCQGSFTEFAAIPSGAFKTASFFIGMSMMLVVTCIGCFSLFFLLSTSTVYKICGWMQAASGCMGYSCYYCWLTARRPRIQILIKVLLCGVCMFPLFMHGFSPGTPGSSYN
ncbi:LHFPL tetraspan subfamily member 3 protein [Characodon lateralis]|uniref:LHFPL tetraspan subfamily member 3 protein n=1 Tax=Characodon lateralis TaxID=208331 RepID=A0ABU7EWU9_9TELE|nr:LHFPL tetraspan subfamily member 3 protein [Characodon lateralis]